jgi:hypothetical protein
VLLVGFLFIVIKFHISPRSETSCLMRTDRHNEANFAGEIELIRIFLMDLSHPTGPSTYLLSSLRIMKSIRTRFINSVVWIWQTLHVTRLLVHPVPLISYNLQNPGLIACHTVTFRKMLSQFRFLYQIALNVAPTFLESFSQSSCFTKTTPATLPGNAVLSNYCPLVRSMQFTFTAWVVSFNPLTFWHGSFTFKF